MKRINKVGKFLCEIIDEGLGIICFDPNWEVLVMTYSGGQGEKFYRKKNALKYADTYKGSSCWVSLINRGMKDGFIKKTIINDPQAKQKNPNCEHEWEDRSRASWWCLKCNAQFNLSCEHSGSVACSICVDKLVENNKPFEIYLAKYSW